MIKSKKKLPQYIYFKKSLTFLFTNKIFVIFNILIEYFDIYVNSIDMTKQLFSYKSEYTDKGENKIIRSIKYISPYYYIFKLMTKEYSFILRPDEIGAIIYFFLFILFLVLMYTLNDINISKMTILSKNINKVYINFYDYFFFRTFSILFIHCITANIVRYFNKDENDNNYYFGLLLIIIFFILGSSIFIYKTKHFMLYTIWSNFKIVKDNNLFYDYPFDYFFSKKYDIVVLAIKLCITISKNNLKAQGNIVSFFQIFINCLVLLTIFLFTLLICYYFFFNKSSLCYLLLNPENKAKIFLIIFTSFSILIRMMYHNNEEHPLFLISLFFTFLFLLFFIFGGYNRYMISNAEKSDFYLGVAWFAMSNDIDSAKFIVQWVINHKTSCNCRDCDICKELYLGEDMRGKQINPERSDLLKLSNNNTSKANPQLSNIFFSTKITMNTFNTMNTLNSFMSRKNVNIVPEEEKKKLLAQLNPTMNVRELAKNKHSFYNFNYTLINKAYNEKNALDNEEIIRLDFLFLYILFIAKIKQKFKLFLTLSKLMKKYHSNTNVFLSFMFIFDTIRKSDKNIVENYKLIRKSERLRENVKNYLNDFSKFLHFEMKTPENFIRIAEKFQKLKRNTKTLHSIFKKNAECNYQLLLLRYIYETALHSRIKTFHNELEVNFFEDFLDFHYGNDRLILLKYTIDKKAFTIVKGSKKIMKYKQKPFEALFPEYIKEKGIEIFQSCLKCETYRTNNIFDFVIKDLNHKESLSYIQSFKMQYYIYPSNDVNEILIQANYITDYKNVIIFEYSYAKGEELLYSLSAKLFRYFALTPEMIQILTKAGKHITFNTLFHKPALNIQKGSNICIFQYMRYAKFYKECLKYDGLNETTNFELAKKSINDICKLGLEQKEIMFSITERYTYDNSKSKFIVYDIKEYKISNNRRASSIIQTTLNNAFKSRNTELIATTINQLNEIDNINVLDENNLTSDDGKNLFVPVFKYEGGTTTTGGPTLSVFSTESVSMSTINSMHSSLYLQGGKKGQKESEQKMKYKQVHKFTYLILCFGLFLMILTIVFLVLELNKNHTFQDLFQLHQSFKFFKRGIECSPLNILSNLCYYNAETNNCSSYYKEYSEDIINRYPFMREQPPINTVIDHEISTRFQSIIQRFNEFQSEIWKLNFKSINSIGDESTIMLQIKNNYNNKMTIESSKTTFIDLIRSYNNYISMILNEGKYLTEMFYIINMDENETSFVTNSNVYDLTGTQKVVYLMILNYPYFHRSMIAIGNIIEDEFQGNLNQINQIMELFFSILLILHFILFVISLIFLHMFISMLKDNLLPIIDLLTQSNYLEFIDNRVAMLKILCEMYEENPLKIINEITNREDDYKKEVKEALKNLAKKNHSMKSKEKSKEEKHHLIIKEDNAHGIRMLSDNDFTNIIITHRIIVIVLFSVYTVYSVIYFLFLVRGFHRLKLLVEYSTINANIDNYLYDISTAMDYLHLTNSSSSSLSKKIYDNESDYIFDSINLFYTAIQDKEYYESVHSSLFPSLSELVDLNLSRTQLSDDFYMNAIKTLNGDYNKFISSLASIFPVMTYGSENTLIKEIVYLCNQKYNKYVQSSFDVMLSEIGKMEYFNLDTLLLITVRIIRTYFNESVFIYVIDEIFDYFSRMIIGYLILNLFLEIAIFIVLNCSVISKIKVLNRKLLKFIFSLRF